MKKIALVTYSKEPKLSPSDSLLIKPLCEADFHPSVAAWDDPKVDWSNYDGIILRSCWNYYEHYDTFMAWLQSLTALQNHVFNSIKTVSWNSNKKYLSDLEQKGVPIIPTRWIAKNSQFNISQLAEETGWSDIIVKPLIGARGDNVMHIKNSKNILQQLKVNTLLKKQNIMVQSFLSEIQNEGEYSFIFIGNIYSHTVLKKPNKGDFLSNGYKSTTVSVYPSQKLIEQAKHIISLIKNDALYSRIDCIVQDNRLILMEAEYIEPMLYFDAYPPAATLFAQELKKRLQ